MLTSTALPFDDPQLASALPHASDDELDALTFGVIGFDTEGIVRVYNRFESQCAGLSRERVIGQPIFTVVAPCMNNYLVAQRFEDAGTSTLDATIDYVLTLRMRPVKVALRLLAAPGAAMRFVLVSRRG